MLIIAKDVFSLLREHGQKEYPHECCGVLLGRRKDQDGTVYRAELAANIDEKRQQDRYELSPKDYLRIETLAKERELDILGIYHSHPDHPAKPSETDRQRALDVWHNQRSWSYLILEVRDGELKDCRSWILENQKFHAEEVEVLPLQTERGENQ